MRIKATFEKEIYLPPFFDRLYAKSDPNEFYSFLSDYIRDQYHNMLLKGYVYEEYGQ